MRKQFLRDAFGKLIRRNRLAHLPKCSVKLFSGYSRFNTSATVSEVRSTAWQASPQVGKNLAVRGTDKTNQPGLVLGLTTTQACALRLAANCRHR